MSSTTLTIDQLCLSPYNVRTNEEDANDTAALERSLIERGQMMPLLVHPMRGSKNKWGAFAGGRRYRSFKRLIAAGKLPATHPVEVVIRDLTEAEMTELSLAENMVRRDLRPYEIFAAVVKAHRRGASIEDIAETIGQTPVWIRRSIRLGTLAKPVFEALERGTINVDQASAYAATEDQALQLAVFEALQDAAEYDRSPARIRARLGVDDAERAKLLRFIGAEAYHAAGGRIELDLFDEGEIARGRICDVDLLLRLVEAKTADVRDAARVRTQRRDLRFVAALPRNDYGTDYSLQVTPKVLNPDTVELPDGDIVAFIKVPDSGVPEVSYWWASQKAKNAAAKVGGKKPTLFQRLSTTVGASGRVAPAAAIGGNAVYAARPAADAAIKEDAGLTQEAVQIFRAVRRVILRGAFVADAQARGDVALDYLVFAQLRIEMKRDPAHQLGLRGLTARDDGPEVARDHVAATEASRGWLQALFELQRQSFITTDDPVEAYLDYRSSSPTMKRTAAAVVAGIALERSLNAEGYNVPLHDAIATDLDLLDDESMRQYWRPTAAMLDLLPKDDRLKIAEPFVEAASFGPWQRLKTAEITPLVLAAVTGASNVVRASLADAAANWVHPLLRFTRPGPATTDSVDLQEEAA